MSARAWRLPRPSSLPLLRSAAQSAANPSFTAAGSDLLGEQG
ncbi:hypothetical protein [Nannocystis pusilla]